MKSDRKGDELSAEIAAEAVSDMDLPDPKLPPEVQEKLGEELRKHYAALVAMPLPDRFVELLNQLAKSEDDGGES